MCGRFDGFGLVVYFYCGFRRVVGVDGLVGWFGFCFACLLPVGFVVFAAPS